MIHPFTLWQIRWPQTPGVLDLSCEGWQIEFVRDLIQINAHLQGKFVCPKMTSGSQKRSTVGW